MKKLTIPEMNRLTSEEFKNSGKIPLIVILDNIRSIHNVGSVFRTSDAFRIDKIIICGVTCSPENPDIHKTALGAEFSVDWSYSENILDTIYTLKKNNYTVYAIEQAHESYALYNVKPNFHKKYAVVLGNEVKGVQQQVVDCCDGCIEIPQYGTKHSLNVSVAAGIVLWHFFYFMRPSIE